ncbi:flagellar biosynthesis repressor FlbT [Ancylobacter dichloromethanicus]|uniref:Flagellum biosynthesis repressor protein FlbT n=1 Tax=Ancylobacter dichloromethanicus TaxID=518825 RepID=A0A9W6J5G7_9HYPH|nr:flagellar biosynthesis repressor FlbT [Ancylobacter dichloromethanicus]MBS7556320.1 flagellar biosynthesis repressor FlbT [Ancylobacter dichloromethanicus]GLK70083.1 putative flagellum biosynthesis repressor protein FlbT [Ancylobacter dichloromethanicus]
MYITLRPGERIFLNGAVIRVDRKVTIELLNDVDFLLENHVLQVEDTTTPLRQLYFVVQTMLIEPRKMAQAQKLFQQQLAGLMVSFSNESMAAALAQVGSLVEAHHYFDALRVIRRLFLVEAAILGTGTPQAA